MTANILLVVLFISAIVLAILVLLQNKSGDMGSAFGGGSNTLFGARGSADFLSRTTSITATVFFLSALALAYIYAHQGKQATDSVIQATEPAIDPATESEIPDASDIGEADSAQTDETGSSTETTQAITENAADTDEANAAQSGTEAEADAPAVDAENNADVPAIPE